MDNEATWWTEAQGEGTPWTGHQSNIGPQIEMLNTLTLTHYG